MLRIAAAAGLFVAARHALPVKVIRFVPFDDDDIILSVDVKNRIFYDHVTVWHDSPEIVWASRYRYLRRVEVLYDEPEKYVTVDADGRLVVRRISEDEAPHGRREDDPI